MLIDPADLLPCHRHLLQQDYLRLDEGPSVDRQYWLAQMNSAVSAATTQRERFAFTGTSVVGKVRDRTEAGLDRTKLSNLAKRPRL